MKQFRKWWDNHRASASPHTCQSSRGENLAQLADAEIWRAALKWAMEAMGQDSDSRHIWTIMRKELENE